MRGLSNTFLQRKKLGWHSFEQPFIHFFHILCSCFSNLCCSFGRSDLKRCLSFFPSSSLSLSFFSSFLLVSVVGSFFSSAVMKHNVSSQVKSVKSVITCKLKVLRRHKNNTLGGYDFQGWFCPKFKTTIFNYRILYVCIWIYKKIIISKTWNVNESHTKMWSLRTITRSTNCDKPITCICRWIT